MNKIKVLVPTGTATEREHELMVATLTAYYFAQLSALGVDRIAKGVPQNLEDKIRDETKRFGEASFAGIRVSFED
jgi:hypothetical protein